MTTDELREKYLKFFEKRGHKRISAAPLVLENDPTTLFNSSGMQQLIPYLMGAKHPEGKRLVNSQPSFRAVDIEEVGDNRHTTFFEMLGNWSLGDYFKKEQLPWIWEFLTSEKEGLGLDGDKLYVSVYKGNEKLSVPKDDESVKIWKQIGVPGEKIFYYDDNWWSRSGLPDQMPPGEIGGPDAEVFFDFGEDLKIHEGSMFKDQKCQPACDCGRFLEIANSVFIEYKKEKDGSLSQLPQKNVDFGGGLERMVAAVNDNPDIFKIDVFQKMIQKIQETSGKSYDQNPASFRVIADHMRASAALISEGLVPSNKMQGYVLRRLIRRSAVKMRKLRGDLSSDDLSFDFKAKQKDVIEAEVDRFRKSLEKGLKQVKKMEKIDGKLAFDLYQTYGFPLEITEELFEERGQKINKKSFEIEFEKHKQKSRTATAGIFKGGLADTSGQTTKLHTVTHLLHASLRKVLGETVEQKGSHITKNRLRFDFSHSEKVTEKQLKKVEKMINDQIKKDLLVSFETMTLKEAKDGGALALFGDKYDEKVKVYTIGVSGGEWFSKEVCGGPHVERTGELGRVRINKEESAAAGVRRIYADVDSVQ